MRHPRQEGHHHAQGHPAGQEDPWRESLVLLLQPKTIGLFQDHHNLLLRILQSEIINKMTLSKYLIYILVSSKIGGSVISFFLSLNCLDCCVNVLPITLDEVDSLRHLICSEGYLAKLLRIPRTPRLLTATNR